MFWVLFERTVWSFFGLSVVYWLTYNWHDDFFAELEKKHGSYRLLQIWVQADKASPQITPIGGDTNSLLLWAKNIETFLAQAAAHSKQDISFDFIADTATLQEHQTLISHWKNQYPSQFNILLLDEIIPSLPNNDFIMSQCTCGVAASCSDILRIFLLHQEGKHNTYMDIDTFIYRQKHQKKPFANFDAFSTTSTQAYGLTPGEGNVWMGMVYRVAEQNPSFYLNNDCLISEPDSLIWPLIKANLISEMTLVAPYWKLINERSRINDFQTYLVNLDKRVNWAVANTYTNINPSPLVINMAGPGFWRQLFDKNLILGYSLPYLPSKGDWMGPAEKPVGIISYNLLQQLFNPQEAHDILAVILLTIDFSYYKKRLHPMQHDIKEKIQQLWSNISKEQQDITLAIFPGIMYFSQEIADDAI